MSEPVLFIAHHFPPMGGPGVFRSLNFVKYLPANGYVPFVLTISEEDVRQGVYPEDAALLGSVPPGTSITRVNTGEWRVFKKAARLLKVYRFFWFFFFPLFWDNSARWPSKAYPVAKKLIGENKIKLVYTTSGPFSSILLGYMLKKRMNIKWVADLRDPFTDLYSTLWPGKLHWWFGRWMEKRVLHATDMLIVNTDEVKKIYLKRNICSENKICVLNNGY